MKIEVNIEKKDFYVLFVILVLIFLVVIYVDDEGDADCDECSWEELENVPMSFADGVDNLTKCNWDGWRTIVTDVRSKDCNGTCGEGMYCLAEFSQTEIKTTDVNCVLNSLAEINISLWNLLGNCTCNGGCQSY
ncbi:MAG: hypothetical protein PVJ67_01015 [Candidatus Pacearchaeota archaeon]|jgi:hypothetical protein